MNGQLTEIGLVGPDPKFAHLQECFILVTVSFSVTFNYTVFKCFCFFP